MSTRDSLNLLMSLLYSCNFFTSLVDLISRHGSTNIGCLVELCNLSFVFIIFLYLCLLSV